MITSDLRPSLRYVLMYSLAHRMAVSCYEKIRLSLIFGINLVFKDVCWCQVGKGWNLSVVPSWRGFSIYI